MKLTKLITTDEIKGIPPITLNGLSQVIAFAGKNGSGKTRILEILSDEVFSIEKSILRTIEQSKEFVIYDYFFEREFVNYIGRDISMNFKVCLVLSLVNRNIRSKEVQLFAQRKLKITIIQLNQQEKDLYTKIQPHISSNYEIQDFKFLVNGFFLKLSEYKFNNNNANSEAVRTFENLLNGKGDLSNPELISIICVSFLAYFKNLATRIVDADLERMEDDEFVDTQYHQILKTINKYCLQFLGFEFRWYRERMPKQAEYFEINTLIKGNYKIDKRIFDYEELSEGQMILFGCAILFALKDIRGENENMGVTLLVDEPENHLHPDAKIELIQGLRRFIGEDGQLIIATHSMSILSTLKQNEIFFVEKGVIRSPGRTTPIKAINSLIGNQIERLKDFLFNINSWAYFSFITECFENPDVIESANQNDPQVEVFKKALKENKVSVLLDFGAGKGRVLNEMLQDIETSKDIDYHALEIDVNEHESLKMKGATNIFSNFKELTTNSYDCILLCNVLHELKITELEEILNSIITALKSNGYLLIIEDLELPRGEKIDIQGFLIQNRESLAQLFSVKLEDISEFKSNDSRYEKRILCNLIPKHKIHSEVNNSSIISSINQIKDTSYREIIKLRERTPTLQNEEKIKLGRLAGLYTQLYTNCVISVEILEKEMKNHNNYKGTKLFSIGDQ